MAETKRKSPSTSKPDVVYSFEKLVSSALAEKHMGATCIPGSNYDEAREDFEKILGKSATIDNKRTEDRPTEVSKLLVDINEKYYTNHGGQKEDETKVTIVKKSENSEAYSYEQQTTSGLEWGGGANVGAQFGLPQVGVGLSGGLNASFKKFSEKLKKDSTTKTATVGQESHHEETVEIPAGHKVTVKMTSYRVRYRLNYTMEYRVQKNVSVVVRYHCCCGLCSRRSRLKAAQLLKKMPNFRNDPKENFVYFTQKGTLGWVADRMEVVKEATPLSMI